MTDAMRLEVKKDQWRQNQDGSYKLTVTINPSDLDDNSQSLLLDFIRAPMGAVYMLGMARVDMDTGEAAKTHTAASERPRERFHDKPYSVQAGIRCQDPKFWKFIADERGYLAHGKDSAAAFIYQQCLVPSRKDLDDERNADARETWRALNAEFEEWAGLAPEAR